MFIPCLVVWTQLISVKYFEDPRLEEFQFSVILHELPHGSRSTAALTQSSLAGVLTIRGRPVFACAVGVTLPVSRGCRNVETHLCQDDVD
jgi:hypothetical protein